MQIVRNNPSFKTATTPWITSTYSIIGHYFVDFLHEKIAQAKKQQRIIQNEFVFISTKNKALLICLISVMEQKSMVFKTVQNITLKN